MDEEVIEIGSVIHYFSKINVAIVQLSLPLSVGDHILIKGPTTDFEQTADSIQLNRKNIQRAEGGQTVAIRVSQTARLKDAVFKKI
jgi:hypothetical protein